MGYYIEVPENLNKAQQLVELHGAKVLPEAPTWGEHTEAIICVVQNGMFDAAAFCYSESELNEFKSPDYGGRQRPRTWLTMDMDKASELTGYR